ncbi:tetratricopeptide repeat protein [Jannaschia sp. KMU-145]|uniref:tetratricopeptide repeat protein n=1 Tax=Jannaschia halovivens TaxID=3388667 RepID=UPI00396B199A
MRRAGALAVLCATLVGAPAAKAQSLLVDAEAGFDAARVCPTLVVRFAAPLDLLVQSGGQGASRIDLILRPDGDDTTEILEFDAPVTVPAPVSSAVAATGIALEQSGADLVLNITFARPVVTDATMAPDGRRVTVAVAEAGGANACLTSLTGGGDARPVDPSTPASDDGDDGDDGDLSGIEADFVEARAAITAQNYNRAIQLLTRILSAPENARSAEAQELLGVVRERNEQFAQAQAEYEIYLERYPDGDGATRVGQRLTALLTARGAPPAPLRTATDGTLARPDDDEPAGEDISLALDQAAARPRPATPARDTRRPVGDPDDAEEEESLPKLEYSGSFTSRYFFRQETARISDFDTARRSVDDFVLQNSLVNGVNFRGVYETADYILSWRADGALEFAFDDEEENVRVSRLYVDYDPKRSDLSYRFGRHLVRSGGVFDRFDGLTASWRRDEAFSAHVQIGSPVDSVRDPLFEFDRLTYGISLEFEEVFSHTDLSIYAFEQRAGSEVDRRNIGFELEYEDDVFFASAAVDYDISLDKLNYARVSATRRFEDRSTLTFSLDYVQSPTLALTNAEQGQAGQTLDQLLETFTLAEVRQFALDRTTASRSATLSYFRPWNDTWLFNADATVFRTEGNPASGGVPAIAAPGTDVYASIGVFGSGVLSESDVLSASLRYADTSSATLGLIDASYRFRPTERLRVRPRLRLGHRDLKASGGTEIFAVPTVTIDYEVRDSTQLELEVGGRLSRTRTPTTLDNRTETYAFLGIRQEF